MPACAVTSRRKPGASSRRCIDGASRVDADDLPGYTALVSRCTGNRLPPEWASPVPWRAFHGAGVLSGGMMDIYDRAVKRLKAHPAQIPIEPAGMLRVVAMRLGIAEFNDDMHYELHGEVVSVPGKRMTRANITKLQDAVRDAF